MKWIHFGLLAGIVLSAIGGLVFVGGCTEEDVAAIDVQITDPNGVFQTTADAVGQSLAPLQVLVKTLPIPHATTISAILALVGWAIGIIKSLQKKKSDDALIEADTSLREVVVGLEDAKKRSDDAWPDGKKGPIDRNEFREALSEAESPDTRAKVAAIRREISPAQAA